MHDYQYQFIEFALQHGVLCFGEFTLKSGRQSPYFFNSGLFNDGNSLAQLGHFYAEAIEHSGLDYDMIFGPAYKGIPLGSAIAIALANEHKKNLPYCFNRKELKDHGEGGTTLGAELLGNVLIVDDVISAGTSVNLSVDIIRSAGACACGVAIALDRMEIGSGKLSAVQQMEQDHNLQVISIINLDNLVTYMIEKNEQPQQLEAIKQYRAEYGVYSNQD